MTGDPPSLTARAQAELAARREREAAALRANLRRRKAQTAPPASREREEPPGVPDQPPRGRVP